MSQASHCHRGELSPVVKVDQTEETSSAASKAQGLKPVRFSLQELFTDMEANAAGMGGAGERLLDQHEIDRLFENGGGNG